MTRMWRKRSLKVGIYNSIVIILNCMEVTQEIKIRLLYDPATPLVGIYPKEVKSVYQRDNCTPLFIVGLFTITKMDEQIKKILYICITYIIYIAYI